MPPRALHRQILLGREIILTEQMDLHLVWSESRIYLKPIPRFLLEPQFWTDYLTCLADCKCPETPPQVPTEGPMICNNRRLWACALGFLISYTALISHESDFHIAQGAHLLTDDINWFNWHTFVRELLDTESTYTQINKRFIYGELRLNRLNTIFRLTGGPIRGYQPGFSQYGSFFRANFTWLASLLGYMVVVLAAMQVGLGTNALQNNESFQAASYGFTLFTIVGSLLAVAIIFAVFLGLFIENWVKTLQYQKQRLLKLNKSNVNVANP